MKHQELIEKMTLEEKAAFLSGKNVWQTWNFDHLGIPSVFCSDGPHGIRKQAGEGDHLGLNASLPATCFPTAAAIANSWDESLGEELGQALGEEASSQGVNILLGPGLNIKRSPLCGRNFEYFSEDPYLAGKMAAAYVRGIQKEGVYACPKHFAVNSQEHLRMAMNAVVDERTLREIYLTGFEIAIREGGAKAIMSSYNEVNGVYANENRHLIQEILRDEWGFDGFVITDWGGSNDPVKGTKAGSNLQMPGPDLDAARALIHGVETGSLSMEELDLAVDRLLDAVLELTDAGKEKRNSFDKEAHHELARKAAQQSTVLLKNEGKLLPLAAGSRIAVIGDFAFVPRYQGAGSSLVNPTMLETLETAVGDYDLINVGFAKGYQRNGAADEKLRQEALALAASADVVLYCFGLNELSEVEGQDRSHMRIPKNQVVLLEALAQVNPNIVGILSAGAPVEMPWEGCCKAVLHGYLNGQAGAKAMLDIVTGRMNPSGRLNETYPFSYEDTPAFWNFPGKGRNTEYREGIYVGYRYYETAKVPVRYPFGYGLSYTEFSYTDLKVTDKGAEFTLANIGEQDGAEVAQLYVSLPDSGIFRPVRELKGFAKIFLKKGEKRTVQIPFDERTFRYWNEQTGRWETEGGTYRIELGASAEDIRLKDEFLVEGSTEILPYDMEKLSSYRAGRITQVEDGEFEALLGHPIPREKETGKLEVNDAVCQMRGAKSGLARLIYRCLTGIKKRSEEKGEPNLNLLFIYNIPFRGIAKMTAGAVSMEMAEGMVLAANGYFFKGVGKIIGGYFRNQRANRAYEKKLSERNGR